MNGTLMAAALGGMILLFSLGMRLWTRTDPDETRLEAICKEINRGAPASETDKTRSLARQFDLGPGVVESLRAGKLGWGEIAIELVMAQQLMRADATTYPTMIEALGRIDALRDRKMGWGKIAGYFGLTLGPTVGAAQQVRDELRRESVPGTPAVRKAETPAKPETTARAEHPVRPERAGCPERPARPERAGRAH